MKIKGIHHFAIVTKDIQKSLHFYHELGNLKINRVEHKDEMDCYYLQVPGDGELALIDRKGRQVSDPLPTRCVRFHHIAFRVDDPREYYNKFLPFVENWPFILNHGDIFGHYACCPLDPDGVMVEWLSPYEPIPNNYFVEKDFSVCPGYHHFCLYIGNREESFKLYRDVLGLKMVREVLSFDMGGAPADAYYFQVPGSGELEMIDHRGVQIQMPIDPMHTGAMHFAFLVDDPQAYRDYLKMNGYDAYMEHGICRMYDPNGVLLEFIA